MRVIFVPVANRPECAIALRTAFELGEKLRASISGCHIRPHSDSDIALPEDLEALVQAYKDTNSDLMVMGAYSRSRFRQRTFGGVTDHMLHRANIPVLMLHS